MKSFEFKKVKILLADPDYFVAEIAMQNLKALGFTNIQYVKTSDEALDYLRSNDVDILITEWLIRPMDGIEFVRYIRRDKNSPNRKVPIIMLTAKGELDDVKLARDVGITEFLVKPFTVQTLYQRIEYLVDYARAFVLSDGFIGPDRRRKRDGASDNTERRQPEKSSVATKVAASGEPGRPIITPDKGELKKKMGITGPLSSVITADVIAAAQRAIDNITDASLQWVKEDLANLDAGFNAVSGKNGWSANDLAPIREAALSIKGRGGTFGYSLASDIAKLLYDFLSTDYEPTNENHNFIVTQCMDAVKVVFAQNIKTSQGIGGELLKELKQLIARHT